ncbi:MAG: extracellular solute-binding protein [Lachnospiraceae bacterium]|nr:extracellular solute-binding protein [Lachnospiraceae bacterium]
MYYYDMNMETIEKIDFSFSFLDNMEYNYIQSMEITGGNEITFIINVSADEEGGSALHICKTDMTGQVLEEVKPLEYFSSYPIESYVNTYIVQHISDDTVLTTQLEQATAQNPQEISIYEHDLNTREKKQLVSIPNEYITSLCITENEHLYFISNSRLVLYNTKEQTGEIKCDLRENGLNLLTGNFLLRANDGSLALFITQGERTGVVFFTDETPDTSTSIRLTHLTNFGTDFISQQAGMFRYDKGHYIRIEKEDSEAALEAFRDRVMAEIVAGKGPELFWGTEEDMKTLADKGVLMDLSDFLTEDIKSQLLPGVLQMGLVNNSLYGITPAVSLDTMVINSNTWNGPNWNAGEMINAAKTKENWDVTCGFWGSDLSADMIFYFIFVQTLGDSAYLDLEQGISYFDQQEFIDTLEFCSQYGSKINATYNADDFANLLRQEKCFSLLPYWYNGMLEFSEAMNRYGDCCRIVGYPVEEGSGNFLSTEGYLMVNANAVHLEEIKEFVEYLLSYDRQFAVHQTPVRMDVLRDRIVENPNAAFSNTSTYAIINSNPQTTSAPVYTYIPTKKDGSSYIEEFMDFAKSCEPLPYCPEDIKQIVYEEASTYFAGLRSSREAADMIHSRVQLYLDEHK